MIFDLPEIPKSKQYVEKMTPEQMAIHKCVMHQSLNSEDEIILNESIEFYKLAFPKLKQIDLSIIADDEVVILKSYLKQVFNLIITISNDLHFEILFRVSLVKEQFLEKGKVRNPSFLSFPPIDLVKKAGVYNRANSCDKTAFYASFYKNVAIRETKPQKEQRIIISAWRNITGKPFSSYPISNAPIKHRGVEKATKALKELEAEINPLFAEIMDLIIGFLASEFVKDCAIIHPKKYEYLYSAFFADQILTEREETEYIKNTDFIIYPSVAWKHKHENVVVTPMSIDKLKLFHAEEYIVEETYYEKELELTEMPAKLKFVREAHWIEEDLIIWEDE